MSVGNPWLDDDRKAEPSRSRNNWLEDDDDTEDFDPNKDYLTQTVERKHNDMLASTERSLRYLNESEDVGIATAEELQRQREVLERSEKKVDKIDQDLNQSEYHIRSIKSLWGAFTNKFRKAPETPPVTTPQAPTSNSRLQESLSEMHNSSSRSSAGEGWDSHPVLRQQDENHDLYSEEKLQKQKSNTEQQIDNNLDQMGSALGRLKKLGLGMQDEIESSTTIITRLGDKVERVDARTRTTNRELERLNRS